MYWEGSKEIQMNPSHFAMLYYPKILESSTLRISLGMRTGTRTNKPLPQGY